MGIHTKIGQRNHACVPLRRILHVWGIKDDYYRLHLNIVMVGFLKTFCTLKVIMVAVVRNEAKLSSPDQNIVANYITIHHKGNIQK